MSDNDANRAGRSTGRHHAPRRSRRIQAAPLGPTSPRQAGSAVLKTVLGALCVVLLIAGGYAYSTIGRLGGDLAQANGLDLGSHADGATDILLVGIDSRKDAKGKPLSQEEIDMLRAGDEEDATNTDTMILIRVPNDGSSATAVSLPRDTYIHTQDLGNTKLNAVYGTAKYEKTQKLASAGITDEERVEKDSTETGRKALVSAVSNLTGITVDHYAEVGLLGFVLLTDAVGGVDVCLNNPVDDDFSGAHFPAGRQTLSGPDALSFVRQRHGLPRGDLDRITRQQAYMASLTSKILSSRTLTDPGKLGDINQAVQRSVTLDSGWDVMGLAGQMQNLSGGNVTFQTIPVTSIDGVGDNGESVVTVDTRQVHSFFRTLLGDDDTDASATSATPSDTEPIPPFDAAATTVTVLNAGEVPGVAASVSDLLAGQGFATGEVGNRTETGVSESQVNAADTSDPAARAIARALGGLPVVQDPSLAPGQVSVTLSGTYTGPGAPGAPDTVGAAATADGDTRTTDTTDGSGGAASPTGDVVGTPGDTPASGSTTSESTSPTIDAGSDGPRCVN